MTSGQKCALDCRQVVAARLPGDSKSLPDKPFAKLFLFKGLNLQKMIGNRFSTVFVYQL